MMKNTSLFEVTEEQFVRETELCLDVLRRSLCERLVIYDEEGEVSGVLDRSVFGRSLDVKQGIALFTSKEANKPFGFASARDDERK